MRKPLAIFTAIALSAAFAGAASADIYRYVDDDGVIHFSNVPVGSKPQKVLKENGTPAAARPAPARPADTPAAAIPKAEKAAYIPSQSIDGCEPYADIISAKSAKYGVDPSLVKSIIKAESNFNPNAVSNKGAKGLMQLMPSTASDMGVSDIYDPDQNIDGGVRYLRFLLDNFGGDVELSVAAYNCGQGRVIRNGMCVPEIPETKNYVKKVLRLSKNPITGMSFSRPIYRIELKDGSILFSDSPASSGGRVSLVN